MKKLISFLFALVLFFAMGTAYSQGWTHLGNFPNDTFMGNTGGHGVAVDPDGKVWITPYGKNDSVFVASTSTWATCRAIYVFNADGSPASFSPIRTITVSGVTDTLWNSSLGLREDNNGNILHSTYDALYRINYQTGEGMNKIQPVVGFGGVQAAVDAAGNIYTATVLPDNPIKIWTTDFTYIGNVTDKSIGYSRTIEVSHDGNTVYWTGFSNNQVYIYTRPDEFSPFAITDSILQGFVVESATWSRDGNLLWLSSGNGLNTPNGYPHYPTTYPISTWYAYDPVSKMLVDNINWVFNTPGSADERPRGLAFSPDGSLAYVTVFGLSTYPIVQKFEKPTATDLKVTFSVDMGVQAFEGNFDPATSTVVVRGSFQVAAGDAANWAGNFFNMTDPDGDTVYTVTATFPLSEAGNSYAFKFVQSPENWESTPDRPFTLAGPNVTMPTVYFNNDYTYTSLSEVTNTINFTADITDIIGIGVGGAFDANQDSLLVEGLDWDNLGKNVVGSRRMFANDPGNPGVYTTSLTFTSGSAAPNGVGDSTKWKFEAFPSGRFANTGWETGSDRWHYYEADGSTITLPVIVPRIYPLFGPIANDVPLEITVDLTGAVNRYNGEPILLDQVQFVGLRGAADWLGNWNSGNWNVSDTLTGIMKVLKNVGGNLWRFNTTVLTGTNAGAYEYKFAAVYPGADTVNGGSSPLDNEGGFGVNHLLILTDTPSGIVLNNVFGNFTTDVERIDNVLPTAYELGQNYPNPFNPSTTIRYSIPEAGLVTVKVFNLLGQEVAILVNTQQATGAYQVSFDASSLSSGIYFYSIEANNFKATKKMILMK